MTWYNDEQIKHNLQSDNVFDESFIDLKHVNRNYFTDLYEKNIKIDTRKPLICLRASRCTIGNVVFLFRSDLSGATTHPAGEGQFINFPKYPDDTGSMAIICNPPMNDTMHITRRIQYPARKRFVWFVFSHWSKKEITMCKAIFHKVTKKNIICNL